MKGADGYRGPWTAFRAGSYIALIDANKRRFTMGAKRSTHPRKYWSFEHVQGRPTRSWEIYLTPERLVQLQYLLAEQGVFTPQSD